MAKQTKLTKSEQQALEYARNYFAGSCIIRADMVIGNIVIVKEGDEYEVIKDDEQ